MWWHPWGDSHCARATTDRNSARGGSQMGGRSGGMNDAPLTNKVGLHFSSLLLEEAETEF